MNELPDAIKGYIAGMIDSDGHIMIRHNKTGGDDYFVPMIRLRITNEESVKFIAAATGFGKINSHIPKQLRKDGNNKRRVYEWGIYSIKDISAFIDAIGPYCIVKRESMKLIVELMKHKKNNLHRGELVESLKSRLGALAIK